MTEDQQVTHKIAENDKKNPIDDLKVAVENFRDMCKELLEEQKNLKKSNSEIVEKLRSAEEKIEKLSNEQQEKFESIELKLNEKNETPTAEIPEKCDNEQLLTSTDSANSSEKSIENDASIPPFGKYFVLKHTFENISNMKDTVRNYSNEEEHFGVPWTMFIEKGDSFGAFIQCNKSLKDEKWAIRVKFIFELVSSSGKRLIKLENYEFGNANGNTKTIGYGEDCLLKWAKLQEEYLKDDKLTIEVRVKIEKTSGVYKENLKGFGVEIEEFSDVVLVVCNKKFYIAKLYLAGHSPYFKALFLGRFNETKKSELELTGIDIDDFQNFLEVLYCENAIDEFTVEGILLVADMYDTPVVIRKCEEFLLEKSKKTLKKKLQMSIRYNMESLKRKCLGDIKSVADMKAILPGNLHDLDSTIVVELLEKSIALH